MEEDKDYVPIESKDSLKNVLEFGDIWSYSIQYKVLFVVFPLVNLVLLIVAIAILASSGKYTDSFNNHKSIYELKKSLYDICSLNLTIQKDQIENISNLLATSKRKIEALNIAYSELNVAYKKSKEHHDSAILANFDAKAIRLGLKIGSTIGFTTGLLELIYSFIEYYKYNRCWYNLKDKQDYYKKLITHHNEAMKPVVNYEIFKANKCSLYKKVCYSTGERQYFSRRKMIESCKGGSSYLIELRNNLNEQFGLYFNNTWTEESYKGVIDPYAFMYIGREGIILTLKDPNAKVFRFTSDEFLSIGDETIKIQESDYAAAAAILNPSRSFNFTQSKYKTTQHFNIEELTMYKIDIICLNQH